MFIDVVSANTIASLLRGEIDEREGEASVDLTSFACRLCSFLCYKLSGSSPRCRNPEGPRYVCFVEHRCFFGFEGLFARLCTPTLFRVVGEIFGREEREREREQIWKIDKFSRGDSLKEICEKLEMQRNVQNNFEGEKNIKKLRNREILKREEKLVNFEKEQHRKIRIYGNFEKK